ncbi:germ cell nuclear acidic protein isoform X2 [Callithrix jacchus]|uniref:germ cell nuclear acidic protein isoform X2 n=1 Tax=Callithrix jacchus TaxID=9483 RepID=UPI0012341971|nr:germ cell nuclear acidic protein isoform X2 [Callithrix jacchus]
MWRRRKWKYGSGSSSVVGACGVADMDRYKEELRCLDDPMEDQDCYILNVQSSSDGTSGSSVARAAPQRQGSCILNVVRSRTGNTSGSSVTRTAQKRQANSVVVIDSDSDSDNECYPYEKKAKILKTNRDGKNMEGYNVKPTILTIQGPLIVISDDDDDDDKNSNDLEVLKEESNDSDVPKDKSNDSDVPDDDDNHDLDVPDDDDKYDSDVPDDDHDSDVLDDDDNHDSDVPDDDHDSDVLDEDSNDSDVLSDSNDWEVPDNSSDDLEVPMPAEDSCDEGQIASDEEELDEAGEQDLGENLCHPPSDPEANLEVSKRKLPTEEEPATVVGQSGKRKAKSETIVEPLKQQKAEIESVVEPPRKRKAKTKNISVTPADKGHKKCGHSKKKPGAAKVENHKTRTCKCKVHGSFLHGLGKSKKHSRIYDLFNRTNCDKKLQEKRRSSWNNKMLRTAGSCSTSEMPYQTSQCFAEIQIGVKVSAKIQIGMQLSEGLAATPDHWMPYASCTSSTRCLWSWSH